MTKTNYILIALLFIIGQLFISLPYTWVDSAYSMGQGGGMGGGNQGGGGGGNQGGGGGQGNQGDGGGNAGGGGQGQGGGNANAGGNNPKAQANKNKNKTVVENKTVPDNKKQSNIRIKKEINNKRKYRVNQFCNKNKEACGTNRKQIIRTDEEKRLIAIELIEAINRLRGYNE